MIKIYDMNEVRDQDIFLRHDAVKDVSQPVAEIIRRVRAEGDAALYHYTREFDKVELSALAVTEQELDEALSAEEPEFLAVLEQAAKNIRAYHSKQKRQSFIMEEKEGVILGQKIMPGWASMAPAAPPPTPPRC